METLPTLTCSHPPTYYLPPSAIKIPLEKLSKQTFCEASSEAATLTTVERIGDLSLC